MSATSHSPAGTHKLAGLDHLRALAVTMVVLFHYGMLFPHPAWLPMFTSFGWTGVDLFFVLSGYLIASQLFTTVAKGRQVSLKEFYIKRSFRILPAYLVVVALYMLFPALREFPEIGPLWRFLTFTQNFGLHLSAFSHAWSLCVEEQFYLLFPLTIILFNRFNMGRHTLWVILTLFVMGFVLRYYANSYAETLHLTGREHVKAWTTYVYYPTYNRLDGLLAGISVAGLFAFYPRARAFAHRYANGLMELGILVLVLAWFTCANRGTLVSALFGFPLISIGWGLIVAAAVSPQCVLYRIRSGFTAWLATLSYALYLIHKIVIHTLQTNLGNLGMDTEGVLMLLLCLLASVAAAVLLRYAVEKPFFVLRDRVLKRRRDKGGEESVELQGSF